MHQTNEKMVRINLRKLALLCLFIPRIVTAQPQTAALQFTATGGNHAFPLLVNGNGASILVDENDAPVVTIAARAVAGDLADIGASGVRVVNAVAKNTPFVVIAGTLGHSEYIDRLVRSGRLDVQSIRGKWESHLSTLIDEPFPGIQRALVIAGSDRRGTAYGLFEVSRQAGVSPWVWWADVRPERRTSLYVQPGTAVEGEPAVKYRGIFINDEDWGLNAWARRKMDTGIKDIGPKTYARVFELMLRLRANLIWPAMHDSTKAFWHYKDNPRIADQYAIVMGSTHCDMMMRSNTFEWQVGFEEEYGRKPGPFRYDINRKEVQQYWEDRVAEAKPYEAMYTVGMRGIRDGSIVGPTTRQGKIDLLDTIIRDQRKLFAKYFGSQQNALQIFCPYKEVLDLYQGGLKVPDDVTLVWTDDNFGYIRQLSNPDEQKRSGASGIYYHLSYLGGPHDYLWLSSNAPSLISFEMSKAYQFGANRFWIANVGDIKPAEMEIQFFMDLAWDPERWRPDKAASYAEYWATQTFGKALAPEIAGIKAEYYRLAQAAKPEHMGIVKFDPVSMKQRIAQYEALLGRVNRLKSRVPERLLNAFFELVEYPVKGAALMNQKIGYAAFGKAMASSNHPLALDYAERSKRAFTTILELTEHYNTVLENGKWNGIITASPRNLAVYGLPEIVDELLAGKPVSSPVSYDKRYLDTTSVRLPPASLLALTGAQFSTQHTLPGEQIMVLPGLGAEGESIARYPFTGAAFGKDSWRQAPYVEYTLNESPGAYRLSLKCLPAHAIHKGRALAMAVSVNGSEPQFVDVNNPSENRTWKDNLLRGYSEAILPFSVDQKGTTTLRVYLLDTGLALSRLDIDRQ
jgi:hypothetical protein